jgi:hypothetical protein
MLNKQNKPTKKSPRLSLTCVLGVILRVIILLHLDVIFVMTITTLTALILDYRQSSS